MRATEKIQDIEVQREKFSEVRKNMLQLQNKYEEKDKSMNYFIQIFWS